MMLSGSTDLVESMMYHEYDTEEEIYFFRSKLTAAIDGIFDSYRQRDDLAALEFPVTLPPPSPVLAALIAAATSPPPDPTPVAPPSITNPQHHRFQIVATAMSTFCTAAATVPPPDPDSTAPATPPNSRRRSLAYQSAQMNSTMMAHPAASMAFPDGEDDTNSCAHTQRISASRSDFSRFAAPHGEEDEQGLVSLIGRNGPLHYQENFGPISSEFVHGGEIKKGGNMGFVFSIPLVDYIGADYYMGRLEPINNVGSTIHNYHYFINNDTYFDNFLRSSMTFRLKTLGHVRTADVFEVRLNEVFINFAALRDVRVIDSLIQLKIKFMQIRGRIFRRGGE